MSETTLQTTQRYYKFMRSWTMTDPVHAKVELVTNSIDALNRYYNFLASQNLQDTPLWNNLIELEEDLQERKMFVRDFSIGMRADTMKTHLLIIGNQTSDASSRGTFSTGAKNVSQLGRVMWQSIRDGYYSSCYITNAGTGAMIDEDVPVTDQHRELLSIGSTSYINNNGTLATLFYGDHVELYRAQRQMTRFLNYFSMRDVLTSSKFVIMARFRNPSTLDENSKYIYKDSQSRANTLSVHDLALPNFASTTIDGFWSDWFNLSYSYRKDVTLVERIAYVVPEYPEATAYFELYKTTSAMILPEVYEEDTLQFGISVATSRAIHEQSCLWPEFRTNEDMRFFFGRLRCDHIDVLLNSYDVDGPSTKNPVSIIDPSRLYGVNRSHKFIQWLFSIPTELIRKQLRQMRDDFDRQNGISSADILNLAGTLQEVSENLFDTSNIELNWRDREDGKMLKAIADNEKFIFLRDVSMYELHTTSQSDLKPQVDLPVFVFASDAVVSEIESVRAIDAENFKKNIKIVGKGELVAADEDDSSLPKFKAFNPRIKIEILYSDAFELNRRYRTFVDKGLIRITVNIKSPCFMGQLVKNSGTGQIEGFDKVAPVLVETMVQAFARMFVNQKIQAYSLRNMQQANNSGTGSELKYSEELDDAMSLMEKEIYARVARAIANGALDDGVLTLNEVINA